MNSKIITTKVSIEAKINGVDLIGKLEYWAKEYYVRLLKPFKGCSSYRLQYMSPVIYVLEKKKEEKYFQIELKDKSIEILKDIYLNEEKNNRSF